MTGVEEVKVEEKLYRWRNFFFIKVSIIIVRVMHAVQVQRLVLSPFPFFDEEDVTASDYTKRLQV